MNEVLEHLIARKDLSEEQAEQTLKVSQPGPHGGEACTPTCRRRLSLRPKGRHAPGGAPHGLHTMVPYCHYGCWGPGGGQHVKKLVHTTICDVILSFLDRYSVAVVPL